ncbi:MAG: glycerol-3-phosphate dehydrogenase [bacterium]
MKRDLSKIRGGEFDLLIVGGGINGVGIARDAAMRGIKTALLEKNDFSSGTTSKSTKLIHGGLRYLEMFDFKLVFEACRERRILMKIAPHLVRPLTFLIPVYRRDSRPLWMVKIGMVLYDLLALFRNTRNHKMVGRRGALELEPVLNENGLKGAALYYDCQVDDSRLCIETAMSAAEAGAALANYAEVYDFIREGGKVRGAKVRDRLSGEEFDVRAKVVVNATGVWADSICRMISPTAPKKVRPTKGIHIITPQTTRGHALLITSQRDNRLFFVIPWKGYSLIGTTDTDFSGDLDVVTSDEEDVEYLLEGARRILPKAELTRNSIYLTFAGLRPLAMTEGVKESSVSREHVIYDGYKDGTGGLITVVGGKLTTYRSMSEEIVNKVARRLGGKFKRCETKRVPLYGGDTGDIEKYIEAHAQPAASEFGVERDQVVHLIDNYGTKYREVLEFIKEEPELKERICERNPDIRAQVRYAVEREMAITLKDLLLRRTGIGLSPCRGLDCAESAAEIMGKYLCWDQQRIAREVRSYREEIKDFYSIKRI